MKIDLNIAPDKYFLSRSNSYHKQYDALKAYFVDRLPATEVAEKFGYSVNTVYSLARDLKLSLSEYPDEDPFFKPVSLGRKPLELTNEMRDLIISLRKAFVSVPEIKSILESRDVKISMSTINDLLKKEGFTRLPRRSSKSRNTIDIQSPPKIMPEKTSALCFEAERFSTQYAGLFCLLPFIAHYGIDEAIANSDYPETSILSRTSAILSFISLKLTSIKRYSSDDLWCMDRGPGCFAGLNVLPKAAWFSSYSSGVTREMNMSFLKRLYGIWRENGLIGETANIDFTTIPYWGDGDALENNWSGKRNKSMASMLAILAQDPDTGIICYGDTTVRHSTQNDCIMEFLDFTKEGNNQPINCLVFDSKATTYQNLGKLDKKSIIFITIKRRSQKIVKHIESLDEKVWKNTRVKQANGKGRTVKFCEELLDVDGCDRPLRHIYITGNGRVKPAVIITNDMSDATGNIVRKYSRRWLVEKEISEHVEFFHLNRNSSGMVIKVDFDFTMTILAHNIYRLFAQGLNGFSHCEAGSLFNKFINNAGSVSIDEKNIIVSLKKKRNLPLLLEHMQKFDTQIPWLNDLVLQFKAASTT